MVAVVLRSAIVCMSHCLSQLPQSCNVNHIQSNPHAVSSTAAQCMYDLLVSPVFVLTHDGGCFWPAYVGPKHAEGAGQSAGSGHGLHTGGWILVSNWEQQWLGFETCVVSLGLLYQAEACRDDSEECSGYTADGQRGREEIYRFTFVHTLAQVHNRPP
jgi:hypothetical protein